MQNQRGDFLVSFQDGSGINRLGQISDTGTFRLTDPKGRWWDLKILKWDAPRVASDPSQSGPALRRFAEGERNKYKDTKLVPEQQYVKELDAFLAREGTPELSQYPTPPDTVLQANAQALTQTRGVVGQPGLTTRVRELPGLQGLDTVQLPQRPGSTTWERPRAVSYGEERELAI